MGGKKEIYEFVLSPSYFWVLISSTKLKRAPLTWCSYSNGSLSGFEYLPISLKCDILGIFVFVFGNVLPSSNITLTLTPYKVDVADVVANIYIYITLACL